MSMVRLYPETFSEFLDANIAEPNLYAVNIAMIQNNIENVVELKISSRNWVVLLSLAPSNCTEPPPEILVVVVVVDGEFESHVATGGDVEVVVTVDPVAGVSVYDPAGADAPGLDI
jgi:hypothetical protein